MKKLIGILFMVVVLVCSGISAFAASSDVPQYLRVGIAAAESSYDVTFTNGFAVYEYTGGGTINRIAAFENVNNIHANTESGSINIYDGNSNELLYSYGANTQYFFGCTDMQNEMCVVGGVPYRGGILLYTNSSGTSRFINVIDTEKYLYGVLPKEMSYAYPLEALKAQAVAARSFVAGNSGKHSALGYDVCNTQCCQVYGGVASEAAKCSSAVEETRGMIAYYNGEPAACYYSANNGGYIESSKDIWGTEVGYLQAKKDDYNPAYNWTATFTTSELNSKLVSAGYNIGTVTNAQITKKTTGGSVAELTFTGTTGTAVLNTSKIRSTLGSSVVKSLRFTISDSGFKATVEQAKVYVKGNTGSVGEKILTGMYVVDKNGEISILNVGQVITQSKEGLKTIATTTSGTSGVDGIILDGSGYGHSIGMSQQGAKVMAENGLSYLDILYFYYTGIAVQ